MYEIADPLPLIQSFMVSVSTKSIMSLNLMLVPGHFYYHNGDEDSDANTNYNYVRHFGAATKIATFG